ncbi:hypothetical protein [Sporomusa aerivorans]|uniref:hypothetical protein n=1 Tax=Sporomusa aerivorans TaxID=204936 RepID=UPI00352B334F
MRLTVSRHGNSTSIYIYFREFDGTTVRTIVNLLGNLLYDDKNNWIGIEVLNTTVLEDRIQLPQMKTSYIAKNSDIFMQSEEKIIAIFDKRIKVYERQFVFCNVDYNGVGGLQGVEILVEHFTGNMDIANQ